MYFLYSKNITPELSAYINYGPKQLFQKHFKYSEN